MPNCKSFLVIKAERKHVGRRARFQKYRDASCHQVFFPLQGKTPKEIHTILTETLGELYVGEKTVNKDIVLSVFFYVFKDVSCSEQSDERCND